MKVALYEILESEGRYPYLNEATDYQENSKSYIRISDIHEIEFEMVNDAFIIPKKVEALRAKKAVAMADFDEQIAKLLSITHQPEEEDFKPLFGEPEEEATKPFLDVEESIDGTEEGS